MRLNGKRVVITAAGAGIGRATALAMAAEGALVFATDISQDSLASLRRENSEILTHILDVRDFSGIGDVLQFTGTPDVLFNCAGHVHEGTILDTRIADFDLSVDVNIRGHFNVTRQFLPLMLKAGKGSIINMASIASSLKGVPDRYIYSATKGAVLGMTKAIAADYISKGIRCNAICPGTVDTPSLQERMLEKRDYKAANADFISRSPMGRMADATEIASVAIYLASDEAAFMTGQAIVVDGGWSL